jgi:putative heme transporter
MVEEGSGPGAPPQRAMGRRAALLALAVVAMLAVLALLVDRVPGLRRSFAHLDEGDPGWLAAALGLEIASYAGYVVLLRAVFDGHGVRLGWGMSRRITLAGVTATRLLSTAGAGGIALTAWALRRAGMEARSLATRLSAFYVLLYGVFMAALVIGGVGLRVGIWSGPAPFGLTVVPAAFGAIVIVTALSFALVPADLDRRVRHAWPAERRGRRLASRIAVVPATIAAGVREALRMARTADPRLAGALAWWGFDILVLWAALNAFGTPPPAAALVMAYFTGQLGNLLPLPGGVGGVEGGMIAALLAFGTPGGLAIAGVLTYRLFAFWLPILPGAVAYARLRADLDHAADYGAPPGRSTVVRAK